jgi:hypothetical protein
MKKFKAAKKSRSSFVVAYIETVLIENKGIKSHVPYDVGLMKVVPGNEIKSKKMYTWYSEEYYAPENFPERREALMMNEFCKFLEESSLKREKIKQIVYFQNFSGFDGILLINHIIYNIPEWEFQPLMINNELYQREVFSGSKKIITFRDSLKLLPGSLKSLGDSLCPRYQRRAALIIARLSYII